MKYLNVVAVFLVWLHFPRAYAENFSFESKIVSNKEGQVEFLVKDTPSPKTAFFSSKTLGIGLQLPSDSQFEFSEDQKVGAKKYTLSWGQIKGTNESFGACGGSSEKKLTAERASLEKAKSDSDVERDFSQSRFARKLRLWENGNLKIAYGMSQCLGLMEPNEKIGDSDVPFFAVFFHKGRYFYLETFPDYREVKAEDFIKVTDEIADGKSKLPAAKQWSEFTNIVKTLRLIR